jgi:flagellar biogenesis protein FliO
LKASSARANRIQPRLTRNRGGRCESDGDELSLLGLIAFFGAFSYVLVRALRRRRLVLSPAGAA